MVKISIKTTFSKMHYCILLLDCDVVSMLHKTNRCENVALTIDIREQWYQTNTCMNVRI